MHSQSPTETSHTVLIKSSSGTYSLDTKSVEFRCTNFDAGVLASGVATFRATVVRGDQMVVVEDSRTDPAIAKGGMDINAFLERQERNPKMASAMSAMRKRLAEARSAHARPTLPVLRQRVGLSQLQLSQKMGTSQPSIARWERDPYQMNARSIERLASALGVLEQDIHDAMKAQQPQQAMETHEDN